MREGAASPSFCMYPALMKCLSCGSPVASTTAKIWEHVMLCAQCHALAEKGWADIEKHFATARAHAKNYYEQRVLRGDLVAGGAGCEHGSPFGASLPLSPLPELRDASADRGSRNTSGEGDDPSCRRVR